MRTINPAFIYLTFLIIAVSAACTNPSERAKGPYQKDYGDTVKKNKADSSAKPKPNPEDTMRKY
ncbi:hypothetical protein [Pedobacter zeae]|uniref:Quinol oxidase subunit 4 n=1 Tax=Pedobacter zeae TaxID=1737356 RepID=A0A7W6KB14_9SPHI|nr:hypothetical protein [Pedobacter zeae]MBB4108355.1 hypothetical protein [Pedobacter zeae]GGG93336.1 hypothetical protein GCM10007422_03180 [Pedobacter zeae]